jgi:hypothetical protein
MPGQAGGGDGGSVKAVKVTLEGSHLRVDARPARMVSLLKGGAGGDPVVCARPVDGPAHTQALPGNARQATFRIRDDVAVEATRAADFVAIAEESGRCLVVAFSGEVTVAPPGGGDRFALAAHEALIVPAGKGEPRVVSTAELSDADQAEVDALVDAAADAVLAPPAPAPTPVPAPAPVAAAAAAPATSATSKATPTKAVPAKAAAGQGGGGGGGGQRRKKGKKGRPQPPRPQKAAAKKAAAPAKAAAKVAAGGAPPARPPSGGGGGGGGGSGRGRGGGNGRDGDGDDIGPEEETPRERRYLIGATILAALVAVVLIFTLTGGNDDGKETVATDATTTTAAVRPTTTSTVPTTATIAPVTTVTTTRATTTTASPTTTARATTTTAAVQADYAVTPKSCVQNGNSITYTASITNKASEPFDFTVSVSFKDASGAEVAKATANVTKLASKRTADFSATGTSTKNLVGTGASCNVTGIDAKPSR